MLLLRWTPSLLATGDWLPSPRLCTDCWDGPYWLVPRSPPNRSPLCPPSPAVSCDLGPHADQSTRAQRKGGQGGQARLASQQARKTSQRKKWPAAPETALAHFARLSIPQTDASDWLPGSTPLGQPSFPKARQAQTEQEQPSVVQSTQPYQPHLLIWKTTGLPHWNEC